MKVGLVIHLMKQAVMQGPIYMAVLTTVELKAHPAIPQSCRYHRCMAYKRAMIIQRVRQKRFLVHHHPAIDETQVVIEITKRPLRVHLRSTQPVASNSRLHISRIFSSRINSSRKLLLELMSIPMICSLYPCEKLRAARPSEIHNSSLKDFAGQIQLGDLVIVTPRASKSASKITS
ncbi:hypothetical protein Tco_1055114 [Tanacetum coccineum]|uniref:Uncharacterized protein n=1 Tax=Tanacetum coccineum TaxID=301880 RepID=A0ABQ5H0K0_9ASTR